MRCENCGWENPEGSIKCEKCDQPFQKKPNLTPTIPETEPFDPAPPKEPGPVKAPTGPTRAHSDTIKPYGDGNGSFTLISHCKLTPVPFPGEDKRDVLAECAFQGECNNLNRGNLDPNNNTITTNVQATLTCKDGKWYIQDRSALKTTFVRAAEATPIKTGDVILMGNRTFEFSED